MLEAADCRWPRAHWTAICPSVRHPHGWASRVLFAHGEPELGEDSVRPWSTQVTSGAGVQSWPDSQVRAVDPSTHLPMRKTPALGRGLWGPRKVRDDQNEKSPEGEPSALPVSPGHFRLEEDLQGPRTDGSSTKVGVGPGCQRCGGGGQKAFPSQGAWRPAESPTAVQGSGRAVGRDWGGQEMPTWTYFSPGRQPRSVAGPMRPGWEAGSRGVAPDDSWAHQVKRLQD